MSFKFNWQFFDVADLQARTQEAVTESIAQTRRPPVIAAPIRAAAVDFGTQPPDLAFQAIPAVSLTRTHIVFRSKYAGDASLTLDTAIEANPSREPSLDPKLPAYVKSHVIAALDRLVSPFRSKLQNLVLDTIVDVVYTPHGVVVNFHEDPIKDVSVVSSLDMSPGVNAMISSVLKDQLTVSFHEDIPESVWASTSPSKSPPDPFRGARRWSQHSQTFVKFTTSFFSTFGPVSRPKLCYFDTLASNSLEPNGLKPPAAISNRGLMRTSKTARTSAPQSTSGSDHVNQFLLEPSLRSESVSTSTFAASSHATSLSSRSGRGRPKRRVISSKGIMKKLDSANSASPASPPTASLFPPSSTTLRPSAPRSEASPKDASALRPSAAEPASRKSSWSSQPDTVHASPRPLKLSSAFDIRTIEEEPTLISLERAPPSASSIHTNGTRSNPQSNPHTPEFQSTESAIIDDPAYVPLPPRWESRRFSSPTNGDRPFSRSSQAAQLRSPKNRSTSMQPTKTPTPISSKQRVPRSPSRSPNRLPSTNDSMRVE